MINHNEFDPIPMDKTAQGVIRQAERTVGVESSGLSSRLRNMGRFITEAAHRIFPADGGESSVWWPNGPVG